MKILILDDDMGRHKAFMKSLAGHALIHTTTVEDCLIVLKSNTFDVAFLDHDLNGLVYQQPGPDTGFAVAVWLREHPDKAPPKIFIHSLNEKARKAMKAVLPKAIELPAAWDYQRRIVDGKDLLYAEQ